MVGPTNDELSERLTRIQTQWTMVLNAHGEITQNAGLARRDLLQRYSGAVYRYLLGAVRDPDTAEELAHDFAVRLLEGAFHRVSPERGRFRDYVKTVLINLVNDHFRSRQESPRQFLPDAPDPAVSAESFAGSVSFEDCLQEDLLTETWAELERANARYHAALLARVEAPDASSREIAEQLSAQFGDTVRPDWVRKTIERARKKFAELLVEQANTRLQCSNIEELRAELKALNLLPYCRSALEKRAGGKA